MSSCYAEYRNIISLSSTKNCLTVTDLFPNLQHGMDCITDYDDESKIKSLIYLTRLSTTRWSPTNVAITKMKAYRYKQSLPCTQFAVIILWLCCWRCGRTSREVWQTNRTKSDKPESEYSLGLLHCSNNKAVGARGFWIDALSRQSLSEYPVQSSRARHSTVDVVRMFH